MANSKPFSTTFLPSSLILSLFLFFSSITTTTNCKTHRFARTISPSSVGLEGGEPKKLSHLRFFFHDVVGGQNQTAVRVAAAPTTDKSPTFFGAVVMMDDPLTESPEASSRLVGRAQGFYASASQSEVGFLMAMNFAFTEGKYNGSTLAVLGRNTVASDVREMPVVGGTGLFRFARGYARAKTHTFVALEAVVEYNVRKEDIDEDDPSCSQGPSGFRKQYSSKGSRRHRNGNQRSAHRLKRDHEFCKDDFDFETIFRFAFGGNRSNHGKSWNWRHWSENEYNGTSIDSKSDCSYSGLVSDRLALGLSASGPLKLEDVKNAYRICALKWHPDRHHGSSKLLPSSNP